MCREKIIPVEWTGWNEIDINCITIYGVTFLEDFGVFKKGENYTSLNVDYGEGFLEYWKNEDERKYQYFKACPINEPEDNIL